MLLRMLLSVAVVIASVQTYIFSSALCSTDDAGDREYPFRYYQAKTLYDTVRGEMSSDLRPSTECSPIRIVMLLRHGSRHPGANTADIYQNLSELARKVNSTGNAELCPADLQKIRNWKNWHQPGLDKDLAVTGYNEMYGIAERFSKTFPELLSGSVLDKTNFRIISSDTRRTIQSAKAFIGELFASSGKPKPEVVVDDEFVRYHEYCERFRTEIGNNDTVLEDRDGFFEGPHITEIANEVAHRLGLASDEVTNDIVNKLRRKGCAEEEWATGNDSSWCLAFTKQDLQAFEYGDDVEAYVKKGFGHDISYRQSCKVKQFVLSALKNANTEFNVTPHCYFVFGHLTTMMAILTEMRLIEDDGPFGIDDYPEKVNRTFRVSLHAPGSANVAFILYECGGEKEMKLQVFLNEKLIKMPLDSPKQNGLWNLQEALQYFGYYNSEDCNWEDMCSLERKETSEEGEEHESTASRAALLLAALFLLILMISLMKVI